MKGQFNNRWEAEDIVNKPHYSHQSSTDNHQYAQWFPLKW